MSSPGPDISLNSPLRDSRCILWSLFPGGLLELNSLYVQGMGQSGYDLTISRKDATPGVPRE